MAPGRQKRARESEQAGGATGLTALHRSRLVAWDVRPVTAVAACPDGSAFAAGYEDGKVELWDVGFLNCVATVPGRDGAELSGLAWAHDGAAWRLFSSHLNGTICEVDARGLSTVGSTDSYGGAVWSLAAAPQGVGGAGAGAARVAAACDDGSVRLFGVERGVPGLQYERALAQVTEGRALSLAWHPSGELLASGGSDGCVHVWEASSGREALRVTAGASSSAVPPCVWALAVLADGTLVAGDSDGATQFFEGAHGALLARFTQHAADVLSLAATADGNAVFAAGVDPRVALFARVRGGAGGSGGWTYVDTKRPHTHDVRALAVVPAPPGAGGGADALLLSGGADGQLVAYKAARFAKEHAARLTKCPQRPQLQLALEHGGDGGDVAARLLRAQGRDLDVWQLGAAADPAVAAAAAAAPTAAGPRAPPTPPAAAEDEGEPLELAAAPRHLARISTRGPGHVACSALSRDGALVAASDDKRVSVYRLVVSGNGLAAAAPPSVQRVTLAAPLPPAVCLAFSADARALYAVDAGGRVRGVALVLEDDDDDTTTAAAVTEVQLPDFNAGSSSTTTTAAAALAAPQLAASPDGRWLAAATRGGGVQLLRLPELALASRVLLAEGGGSSASGGAVTALAFSGDGATLAVATAGGGLGAYACDSGAPTAWTLQHQSAVAAVLERLPGCVQGVSFGSSSSLVAYSAGGLCLLDTAAPLSAAHLQQKRARGPRRPAGGADAAKAAAASARGQNGRLLLLENPCLFFGHAGGDAALLVERPWAEVLQQLPPPLYRHRYGT